MLFNSYPHLILQSNEKPKYYPTDAFNRIPPRRYFLRHPHHSLSHISVGMETSVPFCGIKTVFAPKVNKASCRGKRPAQEEDGDGGMGCMSGKNLSNFCCIWNSESAFLLALWGYFLDIMYGDLAIRLLAELN